MYTELRDRQFLLNRLQYQSLSSEDFTITVRIIYPSVRWCLEAYSLWKLKLILPIAFILLFHADGFIMVG